MLLGGLGVGLSPLGFLLDSFHCSPQTPPLVLILDRTLAEQMYSSQSSFVRLNVGLALGASPTASHESFQTMHAP